MITIFTYKYNYLLNRINDNYLYDIATDNNLIFVIRDTQCLLYMCYEKYLI